MAMRGHAMGGGRGGGWSGMRSMRQDRAVLQHRVKKGTARRMLTFAVPYRKILAIFIPVVILDAAVGAVTPLILRAIINNGILKHDSDLVIWLSVLVAVLAIVDAALVLTERRISAYIGEYLIYDMRSKVFRHIQRMPLAFFTRTQTGALVSRLNNDVIGAQQAFTDLLSNVVGNFVTVVIVLGAMFFLSWKITLAALILVPLFLIPARFVGQRIGSLTKEGYNLNSEMNMVMQERFQVGGAMLVKLLGHPEAEATSFEAKAGRVRDIGISQATYSRVFFVSLTLTGALATALVYGFGGVATVDGAMTLGTLVALTAYLTRLYGPLTQLSNVNLDIMTALVSFERLFEVLDIVPMIQEDPDAVDIKRGNASVEFDNVSFTYPSADEVSLASLESVAVLESGVRNEVLHDVSFRVEPGHMVALVGPSGAGKTTISNLVPRLYDVTGGSVKISGVDVRRATMASVRDVVGVVTQDPHLFHDTLRANLMYARPRRNRGRGARRARPGPDRASDRRPARRPRHRHRRARLPALWRGEAACRPRPAHAQGARRRGPRRSDGASRLRVRGGGAARLARDVVRAHLPRHRAPALDRARGRRVPGDRRGADRRKGHPHQPARRERPVRRPLPNAVRRPGRRGRDGRADRLTRCPGAHSGGRRTWASWSATGVNSGITKSRRNQLAPSTTSVWPVTKAA